MHPRFGFGLGRSERGAEGKRTESGDASPHSRPILTEARPMTLRDRCRAVDLLVLDVDGVLTAGGIAYLANADGAAVGELKTFHVRDGSALKSWHAAGKR